MAVSPRCRRPGEDGSRPFLEWPTAGRNTCPATRGRARRPRCCRCRGRGGGRRRRGRRTARTGDTPRCAARTWLIPARKASVCGCPSSTVTSGAARRAGNAASSTQVSAVAAARPRACTRVEQQPGAGHADDVGGVPERGQPVRRRPAPPGTSAPMAAMVSRRRRRPGAAGRRRPPPGAVAAPGPPGRPAPRPGVWSTGRVDSRR